MARQASSEQTKPRGNRGDRKQRDGQETSSSQQVTVLISLHQPTRGGQLHTRSRRTIENGPPFTAPVPLSSIRTLTWKHNMLASKKKNEPSHQRVDRTLINMAIASIQQLSYFNQLGRPPATSPNIKNKIKNTWHKKLIHILYTTQRTPPPKKGGLRVRTNKRLGDLFFRETCSKKGGTFATPT